MGDVEPRTVRDKGTWTFSPGALQLKSDPDVTWDPGAERTYLVVHRESKPTEVLLIGLGRALSYFEEKADDDPNYMLLLVAKTRTESFHQKSAARIKTRLMREAWKPEYFRASEK